MLSETSKARAIAVAAIFATAALLIIAGDPRPSLSQGVVQQAGPGTAGHAPMYLNSSQTGSQPGVIDGGPASGGGNGVGLSELNVTARGTGSAPYDAQGTGPDGTVVCVQDAPTTNSAGYHYLCLSASAGGVGLITYGAAGVASPQVLNFSINGTPIAPVSCSGTPTSSFAAINGIVTHC
jgi:hypothetical protein